MAHLLSFQGLSRLDFFLLLLLLLYVVLSHPQLDLLSVCSHPEDWQAKENGKTEESSEAFCATVQSSRP